jgi:hypothetical protein
VCLSFIGGRGTGRRSLLSSSRLWTHRFDRSDRLDRKQIHQPSQYTTEAQRSQSKTEDARRAITGSHVGRVDWGASIRSADRGDRVDRRGGKAPHRGTEGIKDTEGGRKSETGSRLIERWIIRVIRAIRGSSSVALFPPCLRESPFYLQPPIIEWAARTPSLSGSRSTFTTRQSRISDGRSLTSAVVRAQSARLRIESTAP